MKRNISRLAALLLTAVLVMTGCGKKEEAATDTSAGNTGTEESAESKENGTAETAASDDV